MQFLVIAYDGTDGDALARRMAAREAHIRLGDELVANGHLLMGTAILDEKQKMIGSMLVADFPTRKELDIWLKKEPYVLGDVWRQITIHECRVGPSFQHLLPKR